MLEIKKIFFIFLIIFSLTINVKTCNCEAKRKQCNCKKDILELINKFDNKPNGCGTQSLNFHGQTKFHKFGNILNSIGITRCK